MYKGRRSFVFTCVIISFMLSGCTLIRKVNEEESAETSLPVSSSVISQITTLEMSKPNCIDDSVIPSEQSREVPAKTSVTDAYKPVKQTTTVSDFINSDETSRDTALSDDQFVGIMVTYYGGEKNEGDVLSRSEFKVEAEYKNGRFITVSDWEVSFLGPLKSGYNSVLISYKENICDITVYAKPKS